jgi:ABC-type uncharacterized transport system substrate-binding protein
MLRSIAQRGCRNGRTRSGAQTEPVRQFFTELRALGYAEPSNLAVERYSAEGQIERFGALAAAIVDRKPDIIVANHPLVRALRERTDTIPILAIVANPVGYGLVASLERPGGNITGVSVDAGPEIYGKRLQILREALPTLPTLQTVGFRD